MTQKPEPLQDELTQSTQAQIEAVRSVLMLDAAHYPDDTISAALTAAAEVGDEYGPSETEAKAIMAEAAALAEIEELKNKLAATIERCAQVADEWAKKLKGNDILIAEWIAAAIRAMKEQKVEPPVNIYNTVYQEAIERCAQVVRKWFIEAGYTDPEQQSATAHGILAAIGTMKDQP